MHGKNIGKARLNSLARRIRRRVFKPWILRRCVSQGTAAPRLRKPDAPGTIPVVYSLDAAKPLDSLVPPFQGVWERAFPDRVNLGGTVLVKINLNTADPYPASTCPEFLRFFLKQLKDAGARQILVGDCASVRALPTRSVLAGTRIPETVRGLGELVCFDDMPWVSVTVNGNYLKRITLPKTLFEVDHLFSLANIKTHVEADFSLGLKLAVGFMHPMERRLLHQHHLVEKCAEIGLAVQADLTIIDARRIFVSGGPDRGKVSGADRIILGQNPLAVDLEAYRVLYRQKRREKEIGLFEEEPFLHPHLRHARRIGIGGMPWRGYRCISVSAEGLEQTEDVLS